MSSKEVKEKNTRNLRNRVPLRQMKLNFAKLDNGNFDKIFGFPEEEEIKKPRKKSKKLLIKRGRSQTPKGYSDNESDPKKISLANLRKKAKV